MKIKKNDIVIVIAGADKGKTGKVLSVSPKANKVVVEGVNVVTKHVKPSQANPDGGRVKAEAPFDASNVAILDPKAKVATRVEYQTIDGKKVRVTKKSQSKLD